MQYERTELLLGSESLARLRHCRVAVFGVGGVGGYAAEALARSGVGQLDLVDNDTVSLSNLNRQIIALHSTLGKPKVEVARDRIGDIDPAIQVRTYNCFFTGENAAEFDFPRYDYVIDAIDTISSKLLLAELCQAAGTPIISAMGAGNKLDPTAFRVADISRTSVCPLARIMRKECKKRGIRKLKVVYSTEIPREPAVSEEMMEQLRREHPGKNAIAGSVSFVPGAVGLILASQVIRDLTGISQTERIPN